MKKLNLATTAAVATVMSASGAYADLSLGGAIATVFTSGDATSGYSQYGTSYTINIDYTTTLDNGMGMATNVDVSPGGASSSVNYLMTMSTDMGSVFFGTDFASAVDNNDYTQGGARYQTNGQIISSGWNDGDASSGNGIGVSSSVGPANVQVTYGSGANRALSIAATMNIMGASVKAGNTDFDTSGTSDNGFVSVGYSVGGFNVGYNHFDMGNDSYTQMGATTSVGGLGVGISMGDLEDADSQDHDAMGIHVSGDLGGAFWVVDYINEDDGAGTETDNWYLTVGTGF
tara:strand:+ start:168 stop:1031 length:864 start_codon:yes stop_codon:yes gene_type:complete